MKDCKWVLPEAEQRELIEDIEELDIWKPPSALLYHYTSREVFWKIMDTESLLARHIMFSNDYEENVIGKRKISKAMENAKSQLSDSEALPFMICFCEKGDLLSQWRGYAQEGVAIAFDFSKGRYGPDGGFSSYYCYTIMDAKEEKTNPSDAPNGKSVIFTGAIVSPYAVIYTTGEGDEDQEIIEKVNMIMQGASEERRQQIANSMIPYIKNKEFKEEAEYRLIFDMRQLASGKKDLLEQKYTYLDVKGVRKPNIRVKFGNQYAAETGETIIIYYNDKTLDACMDDFSKRLKSGKIKTKLVRKPRKYPVGEKEIIISEGKHQEYVCEKLHELLYREDIRIWCDGHMPIRKITVGPSRDAELMKCSIEEYIKTKYWMRDIEVEISRIPLRI